MTDRGGNLTMISVKTAGPEADVSAKAGSHASLLAESDEAAVARWQTLGDSELDAEIASYRTALQAVRAELDSNAAAEACGGTNGEAALQLDGRRSHACIKLMSRSTRQLIVCSLLLCSLCGGRASSLWGY